MFGPGLSFYGLPMNSRVRLSIFTSSLGPSNICHKNRRTFKGAGILISSVCALLTRENLILPGEGEAKDAVFSGKSLHK